MNYISTFVLLSVTLLAVSCAGNDPQNENSKPEKSGIFVTADSVAIKTKNGNGVYTTVDSVGIKFGGHEIKVSADSVIVR